MDLRMMQPNQIESELKIESFVFDFDGTLAVLRLDFAEMKLRLNSLAESYFAPTPPPPFLPVLEWLAWLDRSIRESIGDRANGFRQQALIADFRNGVASRKKRGAFSIHQAASEGTGRKRR